MIKCETKEDIIRIDFKGTKKELIDEIGGLMEEFITEVIKGDVDDFLDDFAKGWIEFRRERKEANNETHVC